MESVHNFLKDTRVDYSGFAPSKQGKVKIKSTAEALEIAALTFYEVNNSLDILYFLQQSQFSTGGFSLSDNATWEETYYATIALDKLDINQSQIINWNIGNYINQTANSLLYQEKNGSFELLPLNLSILRTWFQFFIMNSNIGSTPQIPTIQLIDALKSLQYPNGSYYSFEIASLTTSLLGILGNEPNDPDLAKKFLLAFMQQDGAFSTQINGSSSLLATFWGIRGLSFLMDLERLENRDDLINYILDHQHSNSGFTPTNQNQVSMEATWYAVQTLSFLKKLDELNAPDVLQEVGFVYYPIPTLFISLVVLWRYRKCNH